jgi:hypothetical protein
MSLEIEEIKIQLKCSISISDEYEHFVYEPILLICGHNGCKSCIETVRETKIRCRHCMVEYSKEDTQIMQINQKIQSLIKSNWKELNDELDINLKKTIESMNG